MKNTVKILLFLILITCLMIALPKNVQADELANDKANITSIKIVAPESGIYGVGQTITIRINFDKPLKGTMPTIHYHFKNDNDSDGTLTVEEVTEAVSYVDYTYKIVSGDNGTFAIDRLSNYQKLYDASGKEQTISIKNYEVEGNKITADTTIERTNIKDIAFEWITDGKTHTGLDLKVKNVSLKEENDYYVYFSNNKDEKITIIDSNSVYNQSQKWKMLNSLDSIIHSMDEVVANNGDIYIWICEIDDTYDVPKIIVVAKKIERIPQLPLGSRLSAYFHSDSTSTFCWEAQGKDDRQVHVKIGTVTDKTILKAIKNGESDCLQKLLTYAKSAESIYTGKMSLGKSDTITNKMQLVDEAYYYVYMWLDDEEGKYYPVENVSLYQGLVGETVGSNLYNYLDSEFVWNLEDTETKKPDDTADKEKPKDDDGTTAPEKTLPQTGTIMISTIIILAGVIACIGYIKYKKLSDI